MNRTFVALGGAAVIVVVAALALGIYVNGPRSGVGGPGSGAPPSPSPTIEPSPNPTSAPTAEPTATPQPTLAPAVGGLAEGPFDVQDSGLAMTVTIPASGWTFDSQISSLQKGKEVANLPEAAILLWSWPAGTNFYVPADPCQVTSTRPDSPATTVDDFAAALAAQASRDASEPVDVMVGGYAGKSVTLHVPDDAPFDECEKGEFVSYGTEQDPLGRYHQGRNQIDELWIVDVEGAFLILDAMYRPDTPAELVEEMRGIAESTTFETP